MPRAPQPALNVAEPEVGAGNPWGDDVLGSNEIAGLLSGVMRKLTVWN